MAAAASNRAAAARAGRRLVALVVAAAGAATAPAARASKWTGPTMVMVEAEGFQRVECPADGRMRTGAANVTWVLPRGEQRRRGLGCLAARWTRVLAARNLWPPRMTDAFMQSVGKRIYVSGAAVPAGTARVLLIPAPTYGAKEITGASIHSRIVSKGDAVLRLESSALAPAPDVDETYRDTVRVDLTWTRWRVDDLAAGPHETVAVALQVKRACLPGPVDLERCTAYANVSRLAGGDVFQASKVSGRLTLDPSASITFLGTLELEARSDPAAGGAGYRFSVRVSPGEIEPLP